MFSDEKTLLEIIRGPNDWFCIVLTLPICFINAMRKWKNKVEVAKKISGYRYRYTQKWWHLEVKNCDGEIWNSSIKIFLLLPLKVQQVWLKRRCIKLDSTETLATKSLIDYKINFAYGFEQFELAELFVSKSPKFCVSIPNFDNSARSQKYAKLLLVLVRNPTGIGRSKQSRDTILVKVLYLCN